MWWYKKKICWPSEITSSGEVETSQPAAKNKRKIMDNRKSFSTVVFAFAMVTLLSCCSLVSCFYTVPRVTRSHDAVIIDFTGEGNSPSSSAGKIYGQNPEILNPAFDPYGLFYNNGWFHFGRQAPAPAPASQTVQCGKGPIDFTIPAPPGAPPARSLLPTNRALGATSVSSVANPWPFLVSLRKNTDLPNVFFCSGSLISDTKVLLAAQCFDKMSMNQIDDVTVWVGLMSPTNPFALNAPMTRRITKVLIHGQYNALNFANDIAIITLDTPVIFSRIVSPVCLAPPSTEIDQYADKNAAIMGWGFPTKLTALTAATDFIQGIVTIGTNRECTTDPNVAPFFTNNNLCLRAGAAAFTCADDIGGPVVINTADNRLGSPAVWTLVGINSFTPAGCTANGLKTRVSAFRGWITDNINK